MSRISEQKRRRRLWQEDPHCYWCKKLLSWKESTVDHINDHEIYIKRPKIGAIVLSCEKCNQGRAIKSRNKLPRYILWVNSNGYPDIFKPGLTIKERGIIFLLGLFKLNPTPLIKFAVTAGISISILALWAIFIILFISKPINIQIIGIVGFVILLLICLMSFIYKFFFGDSNG